MRSVKTNSQSYVTILGVNITGTPKKEVLRKLRKKLHNFDIISFKQPPILISTPNPEHIMIAQEDKDLLKIINNSNYALPDAYGIVQAAKFLNLGAPRIRLIRFPFALGEGALIGTAAVFRRSWIEKDLRVIKGREFFLDLIRLANEHKWRVFLLGGENGVAKKTSENLSAIYKRVKWQTDDGPMLDRNGNCVKDSGKNKILEKEAIILINKFRPHLLFVAFGAPKAEKWMYRMRSELNVGAIMVVGRTFDYFAGKMSTPPRVFARNFEWLWTGLRYPGRLGRVFTAFPRFPLAVFKYKVAN